MRPIIVVTGANRSSSLLRHIAFAETRPVHSGVGFGICHRFLLQLSRRNPPDAYPLFSSKDIHDDLSIKSSLSGLTIIMACRSIKRAEISRKQLFRLLDEDIEAQKSEAGYNGYAKEFRSNLKIEIHCLDLASLKSIFGFCDELSRK
jgi:3-keto steroid reductase